MLLGLLHVWAAFPSFIALLLVTDAVSNFSFIQESLKNVLLIFAKLNAGIRYVQGMNEILAPLFFVFQSDLDDKNDVWSKRLFVPKVLSALHSTADSWRVQSLHSRYTSQVWWRTPASVITTKVSLCMLHTPSYLLSQGLFSVWPSRSLTWIKLLISYGICVVRIIVTEI